MIDTCKEMVFIYILKKELNTSVTADTKMQRLQPSPHLSQRNLCPAEAKTTASMIQIVCPSPAEKLSDDTTESENTTAQP